MTTVTSGVADAIAHELGHPIDYPRSGDDRRGTNEEQEVRTGIADMFAYDFDREPDEVAAAVRTATATREGVRGRPRRPLARPARPSTPPVRV
jgi:hypothetical protein